MADLYNLQGKPVILRSRCENETSIWIIRDTNATESYFEIPLKNRSLFI